ncbi:hypothetical protein [Actinoplanes subtropicus]|uniref:hypothetical protein n=1 Tax=Actinoplanes subtropicus TaxID=543632 RepID=UPI0004C38E6B|nr:hypothetical protein [Actinoplanes subtropicus]
MTTVAVAPLNKLHRPLLVLTGVMAVLAVVTAAGIFLDPRVLTGAPIWVKPFKFAVSLAVYGLTIAWMLSVLPRRSRVGEAAAVVIVAVAVIEEAIVVLQAARGTTSHYNQTTPFDAALWRTMGVSIMLLFVSHLIIAVAALRQRIKDRQPTAPPTALNRTEDRSIAYGMRLGLGLSLLGMLAAVPMVIPRGDLAGAHSVGVPDGGPGLPFLGWSTTGGDLRIGHFFGLHALQALPLLAFLLTRTRLGDGVRARLLLVAGAAYGVLNVLLTWQALRGQPLVKPDALTLSAWAALAVATGIAATLVLRTAKRRPAVLG